MRAWDLSTATWCNERIGLPPVRTWILLHGSIPVAKALLTRNLFQHLHECVVHELCGGKVPAGVKGHELCECICGPLLALAFQRPARVLTGQVQRASGAAKLRALPCCQVPVIKRPDGVRRVPNRLVLLSRCVCTYVMHGRQLSQHNGRRGGVRMQHMRSGISMPERRDTSGSVPLWQVR